MARSRVPAALALACLALGAWLRTHGLAAQVVQDDEWHAIHALLSRSPREIFSWFGLADHSIPLTLFYALVGATVGLDEITMRAVQVACGCALVVACARIAWTVTKDAWTTGLASLLVAASPFLVLYSRTARPYAITTLLVVTGLALLWRWRIAPSRRAGAGIVACAALAAWAHPLTVLYFAVGFSFVIVEALASRPIDRARVLRAVGIAALAALSTVALLAAPIAADFASLAAKAGRDKPDAFTAVRVLAFFAGTTSDAANTVVVALAAWGAWRLFRRDPKLGACAALLFAVPILAIVALGGHWSHQGHTLARYAMPSMPIFLMWTALGVTDLAREIGERAAMAAAIVAGAAYLVASPAIHQVLALGPWYGHVIHHFDYVPLHNHAATQYVAFTAPDFYETLASLPPGSAPIVEAPFTFDAPANPMAFFALHHAQPSRPAFIHDLCLGDERYYGEVPARDPRFRFRQFVFADDAAAVRATGAKYLVFYREQFHGVRPFVQADRCVAELVRRFGEPIVQDRRVAVFQLR